MIDDLNLDFEDHDRGRGRRRRTERDDRATPTGYGSSGWAGSGSRQSAWGSGGGEPRQPWSRDESQRGYDTGGYDTGGYGRDPRYGDPRYGDPRYDTGGQPQYNDPRYADPRYADPRYAGPRYDTAQRHHQPEPPPYDPRYDTGSRAYGRLGADERYDTASQRRGYIEEGYDEGALLPGYDDEPPRRGKKAKKKRGRGRSFLALFLTLLLLGGLAGGAYLAYDKITGYFITPDYDGTGTSETVQIEIKQGQLLSDIANTLVQAGVVKSYQAFVEAADKNKKSVGIQPGFYTLHKKMSGEAAVLALLDPKNRNVKGVTIPEGTMTLDIYTKLSTELKIPVAEFQAAAKDPTKFDIPSWWFKRGDGKQSAKSIEGFLYPDTYQFPPNVTAESALKIMIQQFLAVTGDLGFADNVQKNLNISPYEALIAASIVQAEAGNTKDMPGIARVLYNRAYAKDFPCKCLQVDVATNYWLRLQGKKGKTSGQLTQAELTDPKNPYRTHVAPGGPPAQGMPLGPIANPGKDALKAAMAPAKGDWVYFLTIDKAGNMAFATNWDGHCANYRTAVKNGVLSGTC